MTAVAVHCPLCGCILCLAENPSGRFSCPSCKKTVEIKIVTDQQLDIERFWETRHQPRRARS